MLLRLETAVAAAFLLCLVQCLVVAGSGTITMHFRATTGLSRKSQF